MKKNILLIGGSYGIGFALTEIIKEETNVYVASRTRGNLDTGINYIPFDITKQVLNMSALPEKIDGFVFLPGNINLKPFKGIKIETFQEDLQINFINMVKVLQSILPNLLASENPSIVLFSSVAVGKGMPFHTSIAAAKGAIEGFGKAFAAEYAPKIRLNIIAPSLTDTPLANKFLNNEIKKEKAAERHPLKKIGSANDMAEMAAFLLSKKSQWITGQVFHVDGGMSTLSVNG